MSTIMKPVPTQESAEAAQILRSLGERPDAILTFIGNQLSTLHMRAQVAIGFAAVAVTTTGFSGRLIAGTNLSAQICVIAGLATILLACLWLFLRVLSIEWAISRYLSDDLLTSLTSMIHYRNRKTRDFRSGCILIFVGMTIYGTAISIMLLNPETLSVPVR